MDRKGRTTGVLYVQYALTVTPRILEPARLESIESHKNLGRFIKNFWKFRQI